MINVFALYFYTLFVLLELVIGSFLNVCIHRIPAGKPLFISRSHCVECGQTLGLRDLIPVFSYLLLRGRCAYCQEPIAVQYPVIELLTVVSGLLLLYRYGLSPVFLIYQALLYLLLVAAAIDYNLRLIPDRITLPGMMIGLVTSLLLPHISWQGSLAGLFAGGGFLLVLALLFPGGMGGGDIKLAAMIGTFLGWQGALGGSLMGLLLIAGGHSHRRSQIPFGPFLACGALIVLIWGQKLLQLYLELGELIPRIICFL